jgi:acetoin utilization deacetylase AcuC-like enzyme
LFSVPPFKLIYHSGYNLDLGAHVFPARKYRLIHERLLSQGLAGATDFLAPEPAPDEDVLRVHTSEYVTKLKNGTLSASEQMRLELPFSPRVVEAFWLAAGGSILAAQRALRDGFAVNIGGGFHHAFPFHGEGFCMLHDVAIAIRRMQADRAVARILVVDTDVHHGNGTAFIFAKDDSVFTFSIHQENNYPVPKPPSDLDIGLDDGTADEEYLRALGRGLDECFSRFEPEMIFYVGGADPYREDQLGGLRLSLDGLRRRDDMVFAAARQRKLPVAITFAGGYARNTEDTVAIHVATVLAARDACEKRAHESSAGSARPQR